MPSPPPTAVFVLACALMLGGCYRTHPRGPHTELDAGRTRLDAGPGLDTPPVGLDAVRDARDVAPRDTPRPDVPSGCWDVREDFPTGENPSEAWAFGWERPDGTSFSISTSLVVPGLAGWAGPWTAGDERFPYVLSNRGGEPIAYQGVIPYAPRDVGMHPGPSCERAVVRWVAPYDGTFGIDVQVRTLHDGAIDFAIRLGEVTLMQAELARSARSYAEVLAVAAGEPLEVSLGCGADHTYYADSTGLEMRVCDLPP